MAIAKMPRALGTIGGFASPDSGAPDSDAILDVPAPAAGASGTAATIGVGSAGSQTITAAGSGLVFVNTFGAGVGANYIAAVDAAEAYLQAHYTNIGTFNMSFDIAALSGGSASNSFPGYPQSSASFRSRYGIGGVRMATQPKRTIMAGRS